MGTASSPLPEGLNIFELKSDFSGCSDWMPQTGWDLLYTFQRFYLVLLVRLKPSGMGCIFGNYVVDFAGIHCVKVWRFVSFRRRSYLLLFLSCDQESSTWLLMTNDLYQRKPIFFSTNLKKEWFLCLIVFLNFITRGGSYPLALGFLPYFRILKDGHFSSPASSPFLLYQLNASNVHRWGHRPQWPYVSSFFSFFFTRNHGVTIPVTISGKS